MRLGIVGAGAMGGAIALRLLEHPPITDFKLVICDSDPEKYNRFKQFPNLIFTDQLSDLSGCDFIIVAVKPHVIAQVLLELRELSTSTIISIAAGISLAELAKYSHKNVIRVMPNTPCQIGAGISAIAFSEAISTKDRSQVEQIFSVLGEVIIISEDLFPAVTALSGCGPAYVFMMIEALIDAGCAQGLTRDVAKRLISATFAGSAKMLQQSHDHPGVLKDQVTSPGGVTIQALHVLEQRGLRGILWDAVNKASDTQ